MKSLRSRLVIVTTVLLVTALNSSCTPGTSASGNTVLVVKEPSDMVDGSAVYVSDAQGVPHYAFLRKQKDTFLLVHDGKEVASFDGAYDRYPTLSTDGKHVAYWGVRADKVVLFEDGKELVALTRTDAGETDIIPKADGTFVFEYKVKTGQSIRSGNYVYYLFHTFIIFGKQRLGPFGRAVVHSPKTGSDFLLFATKSRGSPDRGLEQGVTEWLVFRNGTMIKSWSTEEPVDVPLGYFATTTSDGKHYLVALQLSKRKWAVFLDGRSLALFDGAMVGDPSLCVESKGTNRIVTSTLALAEDGTHWLYGRIVEGRFQVLLDGKPVTSLNGWVPVTKPSIQSDGRLGPFLACKPAEQENGMVVAYSEEWTYKWGAYSCSKSIVLAERVQDSPYGDLKHLVVSDDGKHYAYAALKGKLSGVTLSRSGFSQNFQGTWHVVSDGKEGPAWADIHGLSFIHGKAKLAAMTVKLDDSKSDKKNPVSVLLDATPVASHEWAWSLRRGKVSILWFSRSGPDVFINRLNP